MHSPFCATGLRSHSPYMLLCRDNSGEGTSGRGVQQQQSRVYRDPGTKSFERQSEVGRRWPATRLADTADTKTARQRAYWPCGRNQYGSPGWTLPAWWPWPAQATDSAHGQQLQFNRFQFERRPEKDRFWPLWPHSGEDYTSARPPNILHSRPGHQERGDNARGGDSQIQSQKNHLRPGQQLWHVQQRPSHYTSAGNQSGQGWQESLGPEIYISGLWTASSQILWCSAADEAQFFLCVSDLCSCKDPLYQFGFSQCECFHKVPATAWWRDLWLVPQRLLMTFRQHRDRRRNRWHPW